MKVEIRKVSQTEDKKHYRITTPVEVNNENELRYQKQVAQVINDEYHS